MSEHIGPNISQQLGELIAAVRNLERRMDRHDREARDSNEKRDEQMEAVKKELNVLRDHMVETKGGRKALIFLLGAAMTLGAFIWDIVSKFIHLN